MHASWVADECVPCNDQISSKDDFTAPLTPESSISTDVDVDEISSSLHSSDSQYHVSFNEVLEVHEIHHFSDIPEEEQAATWWSQDEYMLIRRSMKITLQWMLHAGIQRFGDEENDFCERGLEARAGSGRQRHHQRRKQAIEAVLLAQDFQRCEGFQDPDYISELYSEYSEQSSMEARTFGIADETEASR